MSLVESVEKDMKVANIVVEMPCNRVKDIK